MTLDSLHLQARRSRWLARLAVVTRILLAIGFIPTGLTKVLGNRFTSMPASAGPIWSFFEALYQTGTYWQFLGWSQVISGALLLIPRTAALGAICFLPIMANIFVITVALDFGGTAFVAGLMLLAVVFLVLWNFHLWKRLVCTSPAIEPPPLPTLPWHRAENALLALGTGAGLLVFTVLRGLLFPSFFFPALAMGVIAALALLVVWIRQSRGSACPD